MRSENGKLLGESSERLQERIQFAVGQQLIEAPESVQDTLFDPAVNPLVVHYQQIGAGTVSLSTYEQSACPVSL